MRDFSVDADRLRRLRAAKRLTRSSLAQRAGISTKTLANAENGRKVFANTAIEIADALGVPVEAIAFTDQATQFRDSREDRALIDLAHRTLQLPVDSLFGSPLGQVLGLSILSTHLNSLVQELHSTLRHLQRWEQRVSEERQFKLVAIRDINNFFNKCIEVFRSSLLSLFSELSPFPAIIEILGDLQKTLDVHARRINECLECDVASLPRDRGSKKETNPSSLEDEYEWRLSRSRTICHALRQEMGVAASALEMKRAGLCDELQRYAFRIDRVS